MSTEPVPSGPSDDDSFDPLKFARPAREADRREHPRQKVSLFARLVGGEVSLEGRLEDLGRGGASFLAEDVEADLDPGDVVTVSFVAGEDEEAQAVEAAAHVRWVDDYFDGDHDVLVIGIKFQEPMPAVLASLQKAAESAAPDHD